MSMPSHLLLAGEESVLAQAETAHAQLPVDWREDTPSDWTPPSVETTLAAPFEVTGPATYHKGQRRTLRFLPSDRSGWFIQRRDLSEQLPIQVCPQHVRSASRAIVLQSGCPENQFRMSEHVIAQRLGMGLDNVIVQTDSEDPPLFDVGSLPLVEAIQRVGLKELPSQPLRFWHVEQPVSIVTENGAFLTLLPPEGTSDHHLHLDVGIDFPTAIGKQRIQFTLTPKRFAYGAQARTNCPASQMLFVRTIGQFIPSLRNFGYTKQNILIAGKKDYVNTPALLHEGKSLEAVWHRACLDLVAALSLLPEGRLEGKIISHKAGHVLDVRFITLLMKEGLLHSGASA